jgi:hypothetical protein
MFGGNMLVETLWMMWNTTCASLRFVPASSLIEEANRVYRTRLRSLPLDCMEYDLLLKNRYMKEKHWIYAIFMAAAESLPFLYQKCTRKEILRCILAKASLGASSKLLDNLNDEIHTVEEAYNSLENYLSALKTGTFEAKSRSSVEQAESSACEMASWLYHYLDCDAEAFSLYVHDCTTLVEGQIQSLQHKSTGWPSLAEYVESIAEKSIGDVWIDCDLCQFGFLDSQLMKLKKSNEYIFKSSLVYDDVQDIYEDIQTESVNSAVIRGIEQGIISPDDLVEMDSSEVVELLRKEGILKDIIHLADALFLKGISILRQVDLSYIDMKGLLQSFRLVRLFNLRKLLKRDKDFWTLKQVLASFSDFQHLQDLIPSQILRLVDDYGVQERGLHVDIPWVDNRSIVNA